MRLHFTMEGQGDPVALLHSGGMSGRQWRKLSALLSARYQVIAPDFLGSGANPPWEGEEFDFRQDVAALEDLLAPFPAFHLVGHSYGGLVALTLARLQPERILSLTVYDPVAWSLIHGDPAAMASLDEVVGNPVFLDDSRGGGPEWWEAFIDFWNGPGSWRGLPESAREGFLKVGPKVYREVRSLAAFSVPDDAYAVIQAPALVMTGERTPLAARRVVMRLAEVLPSATLVDMPRAGHVGPITHADLVNEHVAAHLGRAGRPATA